ncbi:sialidase family protein [Actinomadura oligospora]|uniref:sialidase family protein n=1 Tax=Actinomadura oligospora TaxID=111804 RepID=UPI0004B3EB29|nr:sialidase family protein [Actinomadura oligospora]
MTSPGTPNQRPDDDREREEAGWQAPDAPPPPHWQDPQDPFGPGAGPDAGLLPDLPGSFPYAQEVPPAPQAPEPPAQRPPAQHPQPEQPLAAPHAAAPSPAAQPPTAPPAASDPFPYAQQIPAAQPFPLAPETPSPQTPAAEPFPWAQEIPAAKPTAAEPFPFAQEIPDRRPSPGALSSSPPRDVTQNDIPRPDATRFDMARPEGAAAPPPQFDEPWLNPAAGGAPGKEKSGKKQKKNKSKTKSEGGGAGRKALVFGAGGLALAAVAAGGVFAFVKFGGGGGDDAKDGARVGDAAFPLSGGAGSDGRDQELAGVASSGSTVIAVGGESDPRSARGLFLVSSDGGRTFAPGTVRGSDGATPGRGEVPRVVGGSARGWVAVGTRPGGAAVVWTSADGRTWQRRPDAVGDVFGPHAHVQRIAATATGYVAVGETSVKGDQSDAQPVVWVSSDGTSWEARRGVRQIGMTIRKGAVRLLEAVATDKSVVMESLVTPDPKKGGIRRLWRSSDGGRTWTAADAPAPKGSHGLVVGGGPAGFVAVREVNQGGRNFGQVFTSPDGTSWKQAGRLAPGGYQETIRLLGDAQGYSALIDRGGSLLVSRSSDGMSWQDAGPLAARSGQVVEDAASVGGHAVAVGRRPDGGDGDALLAVWEGGTAREIDLARVPGALHRDRTVTAIGAGSGRAVAVGSSGGDAAAWVSTDGSTWRTATGQGSAFTRTGSQRLDGVAGGAKGWVAVGSDQNHPLVTTSTDGTGWTAADGAPAFRGAGSAQPATAAVAAGPSGYVIVGAEGTSAATWFSADLSRWERGRGAGRWDLTAGRDSRWMADVTAGSSGYTAVGGVHLANGGDRPGVWTSSDGRQWRLRQLPLPSGIAEGRLEEVAAHGATLVATGFAKTPKGQEWLGFVSSDGGANWSPLPAPGGRAGLVVTALTAGPKGFAGTGTMGSDGSGDVIALSSADGKSWTASDAKGSGLSGAGDQRITGLAPVGDRLVGVGRSVNDSGDQPVLWTRTQD